MAFTTTCGEAVIVFVTGGTINIVSLMSPGAIGGFVGMDGCLAMADFTHPLGAAAKFRFTAKARDILKSRRNRGSFGSGPAAEGGNNGVNQPLNISGSCTVTRRTSYGPIFPPGTPQVPYLVPRF